MPSKESTGMRILAVFVGLILMAGAACGWHFFKIDALISVLVAFAGIAAIGHGLGVELQ